MILSNATVPLLGLVDTAILGHLDRPVFLASAALGASALGFMYWAFNFLRMGTTGETAQACGRDDHDLAVLLRPSLIALLIATVLLIFRTPLAEFALTLMTQAGEMRALAIGYCETRLLSAPAVLLTYVMIGWFIGRGWTTVPLLILLTVNLLNIALDWWFIVELDLESQGAAWATVCSDYVGLLVGVGAGWRHIRQHGLSLSPHTIWNTAAMLRSLAINGDLFIRTVALLFAFAFFHSRGALISESVVAANAILLNLLMLAAFGLDGFALAAESLSGQALGRRDFGAFRATVAECARWTAATTCLFVLLFWALKPWVGMLFSASIDVRALLASHYHWLFLLTLGAAPSYLFDGIFVGATRTREMCYTMLGCVLLVYLPVWYLTQGWANHGLWFSFLLFNIGRGLSLGWIYRSRQAVSDWLDV